MVSSLPLPFRLPLVKSSRSRFNLTLIGLWRKIDDVLDDQPLTINLSPSRFASSCTIVSTPRVFVNIATIFFGNNPKVRIKKQAYDYDYYSYDAYLTSVTSNLMLVPPSSLRSVFKKPEHSAGVLPAKIVPLQMLK